MMIHFTKLRWRNLISTGNVFTEVELDAASTTLIVGSNGGGKSTMIDALCFALFGKPYRSIKKSQLINSINKSDLMVEVEFAVNGKHYLVRRGAKPDVFEVFMDGVMLNKDAADKDYQDVFEKTILRINYKSFSQVVVLGSTSFVPFMQMSPAHRRQVIEDLLDLQVFSSMNLLLKDRVASNKNAQKEAQASEAAARDALDRTNRFMLTLVEQLRISGETDANERNRLRGEIEKHVAEVEKIDVEIRETSDRIAQSSLDALKRKVSKLRETQVLLANKSRHLENEVEFFRNNDACPTCSQSIADDFRSHAVQLREAGLADLKVATRRATSMDEELSEQLADVAAEQGRLADLDSRRQRELHAAKMLRRQLDQLSSPTSEASDSLRNLELEAATLKERMESAARAHAESCAEGQTLGIASALLRDGGIKSLIVRKYVPVINQLINKYLASLDFFVAFEIDENFDERILSRGRDDFSYASFSEGEKARLDLAIMFAWRSIARMRNTMSTNLLIFDEVFDGSLDTSGVDDLVKIIGEVAHRENVFVISHRPDAWYDKFERVLRFEKRSNFSQLIEST